MTEMVERVARALAAADGCDPDDPAYVRYPGPTHIGVCWRDKYASKARAAIEAMREHMQALEDQDASEDSWAVSWYALCGQIDAALAGKP